MYCMMVRRTIVINPLQYAVYHAQTLDVPMIHFHLPARPIQAKTVQIHVCQLLLWILFQVEAHPECPTLTIFIASEVLGAFPTLAAKPSGSAVPRAHSGHGLRQPLSPSNGCAGCCGSKVLRWWR